MSQPSPEGSSPATPPEGAPPGGSAPGGAPPARSASGAPPGLRRLEPGERRAIARRAIGWLALPLLVGAPLALVAYGRGWQPQAVGVLLGLGLGLVLTLSWIYGAVLTFDGSTKRFTGLTIGLAPARFLLVAAVLGGALWLLGDAIDGAALFFTFMALHVYGHVVEGLCFADLARAASVRKAPPPPAPPPDQADAPLS